MIPNPTQITVTVRYTHCYFFRMDCNDIIFNTFVNPSKNVLAAGKVSTKSKLFDAYFSLEYTNPI